MRQLINWIQVDRARQLRLEGLISTRMLRAVVSISEKVPAGHAIALLARLRAMGWREIWFFEPLPQEELLLRRERYLAYPKTNRLLAGQDGLTRVIAAGKKPPERAAGKNGGRRR